MLRVPRKPQLILGKRRKSIAPATQNDFRHVTKHFWMSESATPATRNEATPHVKPPKVTPFAELTIGTAIRPSRDGCERLRTVANGCERMRTVADGCGRLRTVGQRRANTLNPQTPRVKREPLLRIREGNQPINHNKSRKCSMSCETLKLLYSKIALSPFKINPSSKFEYLMLLSSFFYLT